VYNITAEERLEEEEKAGLTQLLQGTIISQNYWFHFKKAALIITARIRLHFTLSQGFDHALHTAPDDNNVDPAVIPIRRGSKCRKKLTSQTQAVMAKALHYKRGLLFSLFRLGGCT
jgi:hypothetical protein